MMSYMFENPPKLPRIVNNANKAIKYLGGDLFRPHFMYLINDCYISDTYLAAGNAFWIFIAKHRPLNFTYIKILMQALVKKCDGTTMEWKLTNLNLQTT